MDYQQFIGTVISTYSLETPMCTCRDLVMSAASTRRLQIVTSLVALGAFIGWVIVTPFLWKEAEFHWTEEGTLGWNHSAAAQVLLVLSIALAALFLSCFTTIVTSWRKICGKGQFCCIKCKDSKGDGPTLIIKETDMTNIRAAEELQNIITTHKLIQVSHDSPEHRDIEKIVMDTWQFDDRKGVDTVGLSHTGIRIQQILKIPCANTNDLIYKTGKVPNILLKDEIKTKEVLRRYRNNDSEYSFASGPAKEHHVDSHSLSADIPGVHTSKPATHDKESKELLLSTPEKQGQLNSIEREPLLHASNNTHPENDFWTCIYDEGNDTSQEYMPTTTTVDDSDGHNHPCTSQERELPPSVAPAQDCIIDINEALTADESKGLDDTEILLFHGTKVSHLDGILTNNFDLRYAKEGLYGKAIYFAECSEKADQYTDHKNFRRMENLTMLLTNVQLGKTGTHDKNGPVSWKKTRRFWCTSPKYNSVVAGFGKRFREFMIFDSQQCQPKYIIVYNRISNVAAT